MFASFLRLSMSESFQCFFNVFLEWYEQEKIKQVLTAMNIVGIEEILNYVEDDDDDEHPCIRII